MTSAELLDKGMRCLREHLGVVDAELRRSRLRQENRENLKLFGNRNHHAILAIRADHGGSFFLSPVVRVYLSQ